MGENLPGIRESGKVRLLLESERLNTQNENINKGNKKAYKNTLRLYIKDTSYA